MESSWKGDWNPGGGSSKGYIFKWLFFHCHAGFQGSSSPGKPNGFMEDPYETNPDFMEAHRAPSTHRSQDTQKNLQQLTKENQSTIDRQRFRNETKRDELIWMTTRTAVAKKKMMMLMMMMMIIIIKKEKKTKTNTHLTATTETEQPDQQEDSKKFMFQPCKEEVDLNMWLRMKPLLKWQFWHLPSLKLAANTPDNRPKLLSNRKPLLVSLKATHGFSGRSCC